MGLGQYNTKTYYDKHIPNFLKYFTAFLNQQWKMLFLQTCVFRCTTNQQIFKACPVSEPNFFHLVFPRKCTNLGKCLWRRGACLSRKVLPQEPPVRSVQLSPFGSLCSLQSLRPIVLGRGAWKGRRLWRAALASAWTCGDQAKHLQQGVFPHFEQRSEADHLCPAESPKDLLESCEFKGLSLCTH